MLYKRELQYETLIPWEQISFRFLQNNLHKCSVCSANAIQRKFFSGICALSSSCCAVSLCFRLHFGVLPAVPALASALTASSKQFYLIFRSLILFSLSLFLRISMNWLKKCSWSFFFWTRRNRWSLPYFSANSLNVVLGDSLDSSRSFLNSSLANNNLFFFSLYSSLILVLTNCSNICLRSSEFSRRYRGSNTILCNSFSQLKMLKPLSPEAYLGNEWCAPQGVVWPPLLMASHSSPLCLPSPGQRPGNLLFYFS